MEKAWHFGWPESVTTGKIVTTWPEPPYTDVDGDGGLEVILSMFNSEGAQTWLVRIYDAVTGKMKYRYSGMIASRCVDIDGDGAAEIIGNVSSDPTQTRLEGAQLLGVADGKLAMVWEDHKAEALDMLPLRTKRGKRIITGNRLPVHQPARIKKGQGIFTLAFDRQGRLRLDTWRAPEPEPRTDFSAIPAMQGAAMPVLLAADLTGDGTNELVLYKTPEVQVLHFTGKSLDHLATYRSDSIPVLADLNGDGQTEIVCMTVTTTTTPVVEAVTPALGNKRLWRCEFPKADRSGLPAPRRAYIRTIHLTGQPTPDLYVWAGTPLVRSVGLNGLTGEILWEKGEVPDSPARQYSRYYGPSMNYASAFDFNGDGNEDLVFTNPDYYCIADGPTADLLLGPLFPKEVFNQPSQGLYTYPAILKTKGAIPTTCLIGGHYFQAAMSLRADPYWYKLPMAGESRCGMEGFLQLEDGTWLMGFGRQNGNFACKNAANGAVQWEMPLEVSVSDVVTCDVDGDGRSEYLFGTSHGDLCAVGDGGERPRVVWKLDLGVAVGAPIAADLDGDGSCEVVVPTADGYVRVFDHR